jgi:predicted small secreted protein
MRNILTLATVLAALAVSACNTVEGAGKDVSSAGDAVAKTADEAKPNN